MEKVPGAPSNSGERCNFPSAFFTFPHFGDVRQGIGEFAGCVAGIEGHRADAADGCLGGFAQGGVAAADTDRRVHHGAPRPVLRAVDVGFNALVIAWAVEHRIKLLGVRSCRLCRSRRDDEIDVQSLTFEEPFIARNQHGQVVDRVHDRKLWFLRDLLFPRHCLNSRVVLYFNVCGLPRHDLLSLFHLHLQQIFERLGTARNFVKRSGRVDIADLDAFQRRLDFLAGGKVIHFYD